MADLDLSTDTAHVVRGKGGKGRRVKFSASCAAVLDRYLRARRAAGNPADRGPLWVGREGALTYRGLVYTLRLRAEIAGLKGFHVHRLRHSMAVRWLQKGGSETGLDGPGRVDVAHHDRPLREGQQRGPGRQPSSTGSTWESST